MNGRVRVDRWSSTFTGSDDASDTEGALIQAGPLLVPVLATTRYKTPYPESYGVCRLASDCAAVQALSDEVVCVSLSVL